MTQEKDNMDSAKTPKTSSIPPPGHEETMAENIQQSQIEADEGLTHAKTNQSEAEPEYPTRKKLIPTVIALYLSFFLVALVCHTSPARLYTVKTNGSSGPYNHRNRHPYNHGRIPFPQ